MTLASSGTISIGGSTANRSINLELGRSATATSSLGETSLRTLAGVSSGAISLSNFHGKAHILDTQTVTVGYKLQNIYGANSNSWGFYSLAGSITDGTCNFKSGATISVLLYTSFSIVAGQPAVHFALSGSYSNSGFNTMTIDGNSYARTDASFRFSNFWVWTVNSNPFGTTVGATKTVTWT